MSPVAGRASKAKEGWIILALMAAIYVVPTIVAVITGNRQFAVVFALNFLAGWTGFGWMVALVLALWNWEGMERKGKTDFPTDRAARRLWSTS